MHTPERRGMLSCTDDVVYVGYRIVMLSGHEYDDGLGNLTGNV